MDNKLKTVDAETLLSTPMSKTMFIVDGLISQGVNVISGASKIGKSWLMLWLGLQVAQGNSIWGLPTLQCDVLYLSLEDTQRRIKDRLYNLTDSAPDNLYFAVTSGLIGGGLEEQITDFLTEHPATKLVIIDTLQKVRDSKRLSRATKNLRLHPSSEADSRACHVSKSFRAELSKSIGILKTAFLSSRLMFRLTRALSSRCPTERALKFQAENMCTALKCEQYYLKSHVMT